LGNFLIVLVSGFVVQFDFFFKPHYCRGRQIDVYVIFIWVGTTALVSAGKKGQNFSKNSMSIDYKAHILYSNIGIEKSPLFISINTLSYPINLDCY
jgi:hypothetical protein